MRKLLTAYGVESPTHRRVAAQIVILLTKFAQREVVAMSPGTYAAVGAALAACSAALLRLYRPWHLGWGASASEVRAQLPGDDVVAEPTFDATRGVTVNASPEAIWPWIAQLGFGRAGWYSYDVLDNLGRPSAERLIPSLQRIAVGDVVPMGPGGAGLRVKELEPEQWLLWWDGRGYSTWLWRLTEVAPGRTRLVTRVRMQYRWAHPSILFALLLMEPWDFPMMRKCMLGIKRRAEETRGHELPRCLPGVA